MKKFSGLFLFATAVMTASISLDVAAAPTSFPLFCRGGDGMTMQIMGDVRTRDGALINLYFRKGTRAATSGVRPGECTWSDRGFRSSEPAVLTLKFSGAYLTTKLGKRRGGTVPTFQYSGGSIPVSQLRNFINAFVGNGNFQMHAYNKGRTLVVTKYGP